MAALKLFSSHGGRPLLKAILFVSLAFSPFVGRSQSCLPPPPGLVSLWGGDGTADDLVGSNPGSLHSTSFAVGKVDQAFSFDGFSSYIRFPASTSLDVGAGTGLTIEGWIRPDDLSGGHLLAEWNDGNGNVGVQLHISIPQLGGLGSLFANVLDSAGVDHYFATASDVLSVGVFQHVALTYDQASGDAKLYLNGTPLKLEHLGGFRPQTTYDLYLGTRFSGPGAGEFFDGLMDEVGLYDRALSDSEILDAFNAGSAGKCKTNPPSIISQPASRTVHSGANVTFTVGVSGSYLRYQWHFNDDDIPGATNATLTLPNVLASQAGSYSVTVTNDYGSAPSGNAVLVVNTECLSAPAGLVGWWPAEGDARDYFNANDGVLLGDLTISPGETGQAFNFDGTNGYISLGAPPSLNVGTGSGVTIECWIKPGDVSSQHTLAEWNDRAGRVGMQLQFSVASLGGLGSLLANVRDTAGNDHLFSSAPNLITNNGFQHVAVTYDKASGLGKLYRNGAVVKSQNVGVFTPQTTYGLYLGKRVSGPGTGSFYKGLMDELAIYNRALSDSEVQTIFNSGSAGKTCIPPEILSNPPSFTVKPGTNLTFGVSARGGFPLNYGWRLNGTPLSRGTNAILTLTNVQPSDAGAYSVQITNSLGKATSSNGVLKVTVLLALANSQPLINTQYSFGGPVTIQLQNFYTNGLVFYTLDGSTPTLGSSQYTGAFALTHSVVLRALGYSSDFLQSGELDPVTILILPTYSVSVTNGGGGGSVALSPSGGNYLSNSLVTLTANPAAGWRFLQWQGDAAGTNPVASVSVNRNQFILAIFGTSVNATTAGNGLVVLNPSTASFPYGTVVWCSAVPLAGSYFGFWGNAASGDVNPFRLVVTNPSPTVSCIFGSVGAGQAALTVVPLGNGQVTVSPRANIYNTGQNISVTATPDAGQSFLGWTGDASGTQNPLPVTMDQGKIIYATFSHNPRLSLIGTLDGLKTEGFRFTLVGDFGASYEIDGATNLPNWTPLGVVTNPFGRIQFLDAGSPTANRRFYRALLLP